MYFIQWLERQHRRDDPTGDIARDWRDDWQRASFFAANPANPSLRALYLYLCVQGACSEAKSALIGAWREWQNAGYTYRTGQQEPLLGYLSLRFRVFKRDDYRCQICGRSAADGARLEADHKVPRSKGGPDTLANLWTLCFECNRGKRDSYL